MTVDADKKISQMFDLTWHSAVKGRKKLDEEQKEIDQESVSCDCGDLLNGPLSYIKVRDPPNEERHQD